MEKQATHFKSYLIGFILSVLFVLLAYHLVKDHSLDTQGLYIAISVIAVLQLLFQVIFVFRLNAKTENDRWHLITFIFTILIMAIVVTGSLWIMYNLNYNMVN